MKRTRFSWRVAAVVGVLALVAATAVAASAWARGGHAQATTLVDGTTDSVTNLDPANEYDYGSATLDLLMFQGLYGYPHGAKLEPLLATRCAPRAGNTAWTCTLKRNVKFADGTPFTSADVKWSFDRVQKIKGDQGIYALLSNLKSTSVNGTYGVTFHLKSAAVDVALHPRHERGLHRPEGALPGRQDPRQLRVAGRHRAVPAGQVHARPAGGLQGEPELLGPEAQERQPDHQLLLEVLDDEARPAARRDRHGVPRLHAHRAPLARQGERDQGALRQRRRDPLHGLQPDAGADEQHRRPQGDRVPDAAADDLDPRLPRVREAALLDGAGRSTRSHRRVRDDVRPDAERGEGPGGAQGGRRHHTGPDRHLVDAEPLRRRVRRRVRRDPACAERQRAVQGDAEVHGVGAVQRPARASGTTPSSSGGSRTTWTARTTSFRSTSRTTSWRTATTARR